jgi:hypothetical protein
VNPFVIATRNEVRAPYDGIGQSGCIAMRSYDLYRSIIVFAILFAGLVVTMLSSRTIDLGTGMSPFLAWAMSKGGRVAVLALLTAFAGVRSYRLYRAERGDHSMRTP